MQIGARAMSDAVIREFKRTKNGSALRLVSQFDGEPVWFESEDVELEPSIEALGTIWLIPCILSNRNIKFEQPVCKLWYENAHALIDFLKDNWGTAKIELRAETYETTAVPQEAAGICFSGGVDSFYTLLKKGSPKYLVSAVPFDQPSSSIETFKVVRKRLETVAQAVGSIPITVRSNVIEHPSFRIHQLLDTHSPVLASLGHLLSRYIGSISISPSYHKTEIATHACRSHLDALSSSKSLEVVHHVDTWRRERVAAIADWQLARENLFVCFNKLGLNRNCSRCEKCIRTMLDLHILGKLESFKVFDQSVPLWEAMESVKLVTFFETYEQALQEPIDSQLKLAIRRMIRREFERITRLENAERFRRHVDEEFSTIQEGLANALHHYSLLQENYDNLLNDYREVVENRPLKRGVRAVRHVMRMLRASRVAKSDFKGISAD